ncbi:NAD(P)H-binding protein [Gordonia soli]|nr:NAD(P)H-binding protein [Gordonia soli]
MRLLVTGATGYVGSRLVCTLLGRGHEVVVTSRNADSLRRFSWHDRVTPVAMDAHDADSVAAALRTAGDVDALYYLLHGIGEADFRDADRAAARTVAEASRDAGVGRIIYLGGFVPDGGENGLSTHLASRAEVGDALSVPDGPDVVWLRAAVVLGAGSTSFEIIRYLSDRLPVIPLPSWIDNPMDPISIRDVLYYLAEVADPVVTAGAYDIAGPDRGKYRTMIEEYLRAIPHPRLRVWAPPVPTRLAGAVGGAVIPVPFALTADLVTSLDHPMNASENRIRSIVPDPPGGLLPIRVAVRAAVHSRYPRPVCELADVHHLAETDPDWAGGDWVRLRRGVRNGVRGVIDTATAPIRLASSLASWP